MKKIISFMLLFFIGFSLTGCGLESNIALGSESKQFEDDSISTEPTELYPSSDETESTEQPTSSNEAYNRQYQVLFVEEASDFVSLLGIDSEYPGWAGRNSYINNSQPKQITGSFGHITYSGTYFEDTPLFGTNKYVHMYIGNSDDEIGYFTIDDNGELKTCLYRHKDVDEIKSVEELRKIVKGFINQLYGEEISDEYEEIINPTNNENPESYSFDYVKKVKGIDSMDFISVNINASGRINGFVSKLFGEINVNDIPKFDIDIINKSVNNRVEALLSEMKQEYESICYYIKQYYLTKLDNSTYAFDYSVAVEVSYYEGDSLIGEGDVIELLVPLN